MYSFKYTDEEKKLFVFLPREMKYDFDFIDAIAEFMEKVEESEYKDVFVCGEKEMNSLDKMCAAYLLNTLYFLARRRNVYVKKDINKIFHEKVSHTDGGNFNQIDVGRDSGSAIQQCYNISDDKNVDQTVQILVDFIFKHNLFLNNAKEFLITTIGEIFSNAFIHSDENKIFFMYDITWDKKDEISLLINVTDYGKTIIHNVREYQEKYWDREMGSSDCISWALGEGNTTRQGSGGYGLPTLIDYVTKIAGEMFIFTGDAVYILSKGKGQVCGSKGNFYGTSITMRIPLFNTTTALMYDEKQDKIISINLDQL